jgi:ATP-dependent DNA helicase RecG
MNFQSDKLIAECTAYDFKKELERKKIRDWLKSVSAFANTDGGSLFFGVDNDGTIVGLEDPQSVSDFISEKVNSHLDPVPTWSLIPHEVEGKPVIELSVKRSFHTPYYVNLDGTRKAYVRSGNESVQVESFQLVNLILKGNNTTWDAIVTRERAEEHSFTMLANAVRERTKTPWEPKLLESFGLVTAEGFLTNAGLLFSDNCNVFQSRIFCTKWNGLEKDDAVNDSEYRGNLLYLLQMATSFVKANTAKRWYKLPSYRLNFPEYAERAIEEACVNHLIHRDMTVIGSEVHIDIYDDRIEFYSPGGMIDGTFIQDQDYRKVASKRRNPILAEVFSQLDYMEKRGSGLKKIVNRTATLTAFTEDKTPYFRSDTSSFFTIVPNVNYGLTDADFQRIIDSKGGNDETIEPYQANGVDGRKNYTKKLHQKTTPKNYTKTTPKRSSKILGSTSQLIIDTLIDDPLASVEKLSRMAGISPDGVKWQLSKLKRDGYIERVGSSRSGAWKVLVKK